MDLKNAKKFNNFKGLSRKSSHPAGTAVGDWVAHSSAHFAPDRYHELYISAQDKNAPRVILHTRVRCIIIIHITTITDKLNDNSAQ